MPRFGMALRMVQTQDEFHNFYRHCGQDWDSTWDCMCNDECPHCGSEIEPYQSIDLGTDEIINHCNPHSPSTLELEFFERIS